MSDFWNGLKVFLNKFLTRGSFINNFGVIAGGKLFAIVLGVVLTPVLSRLFSPESYGKYAIFFLFVSNLSVLGTLQLPLAFIVERNESSFKDLVKTTSTFIILFTAILFLIFYFWEDFIFNYFEIEEYGQFSYLIPLGVGLYSYSFLLGNWNIREKEFRKSTKVAMSESVSIKITNLGLGFFCKGPTNGLILGDISGKSINILLQFYLFVKGKWLYLIPNSKTSIIKQVVSNYWQYPALMLPNTWVNTFSNSLIVLYFSLLYPASLVGELSMSTSLIFIPITLFATSSQPVLMQKIAEQSQSMADVGPLVRRFVTSFIYLGSFMVFCLITLSGHIIEILIGKQWSNVAVIIEFLAPTALFTMLQITLQGVLIALEKRPYLLRTQLSVLTATSVSLFLASILTDDFQSSLIIYSVSLGIVSTIMVIHNLKVIGARNLKPIFMAYSLFLGSCFVAYLIIL